ncbi:MAG TPA: oxygenase MpaB family protein [Archangium sp.]|uniref:oxygenase MpaB family protein n=1 Tax=Archangium sp. TaxID=1872627 RepID=UPI002E33D62D|nr:oxygenase MpaB family protein [Archangium sp.]HEX5749664.1 oxygenase MpaB family protein [Archangium sp.]
MRANRWTDDLLDGFRTRGDPLADETVKNLFQQGQVETANALLKQLIRNDQLVPGELPEMLREYLLRTEQLPDWADPALVRHGEALFGRYGPQAVVSLFCGALPASYAAAKGVQVIHLTARLVTDPFRRIMETAQMLIDVLAPDGLAPGGSGIRSAQKVRLMHAAVRHLLLESGQWNPAWGYPINQEDMAGTLVDFSYAVIVGLEKLGCTLSREEQNAYLHCWKVVGHLMGLETVALPEDIEDCAALAEAVQRRHFRASPEGQEMTRALIQMAEHVTPGNLFDGMAASLIRHILGEEVADMLKVPPADWTRYLIGPLAMLGRASDELGDHSRVVARLSEVFGRKLVEGMVWMNRGAGRPPFRIPSTLRESWNVQGR